MKKVLTTAAALAMLAPTMTSFASSTDEHIIGTKDQYSSELSINGQIFSDSNQAPLGQINITLPTAAAFTVDSDSTVLGAQGMKIKNDISSTDVKVSVASFSDSTPDAGIVLKPATELSDEGKRENHQRSDVSLKLAASGADGQTVELLNNISNANLVTLNPGDISSLTLSGVAGTADASPGTTLAETGISEDFILTFKIEKVK